jgi:hypothetical protein
MAGRAATATLGTASTSEADTTGATTMHPTIAQQFAEHRQTAMLRDAELARLAGQVQRQPGFLGRTVRQLATAARQALHGPTTRHGVGPAIPAPRHPMGGTAITSSPIHASAAQRVSATGRTGATRSRTARPSPSL